MDAVTFERLVDEALDELPAAFRERLDNVVIVVEDWPDRRTLSQAGVSHRAGLLGFYHGIPLPARNHGYNLVAPDRISIYREPILLHARGERRIRETIRRVLLHEIAHHFGIDDDRLHDLGAY